MIYTAIVPGAAPRKNARGTIANGRRITPARTRTWRDRLRSAFAGSVPIRSGAWRVTIDVYEARIRHLDVEVPLGDVDSSISIVLDALQDGPAPLLDDDARIVEVAVRKHYDKFKPRVEVRLEQIPWITLGASARSLLHSGDGAS